MNNLLIALRRGLEAIANRIMDSGVQPNLRSLNEALDRDLEETANRIMNSGVQPNLISLNYALDSGFEATANRIMDLGVQPNLRSLSCALDSGLKAAANRIMDSGMQPEIYSLNSALKGGLFEIAETVILPSLSRRNIQPYENIKLVKDFMDHQRSKENISSLGTFLSNMTNPVNTDLISALRPVMENHFSPLKNKKRPRPSIR
jgi:hypothetical protein